MDRLRVGKGVQLRSLGSLGVRIQRQVSDFGSLPHDGVVRFRRDPSRGNPWSGSRRDPDSKTGGALVEKITDL